MQAARACTDSIGYSLEFQIVPYLATWAYLGFFRAASGQKWRFFSVAASAPEFTFCKFVDHSCKPPDL